MTCIHWMRFAVAAWAWTQVALPGWLRAAPGKPSAPEGALAAGFREPPKSARPSVYYLMLNGYLNRDYADHELEELARMGISGLCIFDMGARGPNDTLPPAGPAFMSEEWLDPFAHVVRKAGELGQETQLAVCSSWDMGASWVEPKDASMALYHSTLEIEGPTQLDARLPLPAIPDQAPRDAQGNPAFLREVSVLAIPGSPSPSGGPPRVIEHRESIMELTRHLRDDGRLHWKVPKGKWVIIRFVCANTGERLKVPSPASDGLATDHFRAEVTRSYIRHVTGRLEARLGDLRQTALKRLYLPSYEVRGQVWTPDLMKQFQHYRHYDMTRFLPALIGYVVENDETTQSFLYDFRKTMGDLLVDAYYRAAGEAAHRAGLGIEAEAGGPGPPVHQVPVDALKALGAMDEMRGEFWPWRLDNDPLWVVKETACAAHIYGHRLVHMEAFTGFRHWQDGPFDLKFSADRAFGEGMNRVVWHTSSHQPPEAGKPGWVYGAGTHLTPNLVWWPMAKPFLEYLSRCSYLLQQGLFVADVCHYYGDQGYNFVPPKHVNPSLGYGYDYDVVNLDVILNRMTVHEGRITLPDGMHYELLALPDRGDMDLDALRRIAELVRGGATVVGPKPIRANGLTDRSARDRQVRRLADAVWGGCDGRQVLEHQYGKGRVVWGRSLRDVLSERGVGPDFHFASEQEDADLDFIHRRTREEDIYFLRNTKMRWERVEAHFRVPGKVPEIWAPDTGMIRHQPVYERTREGVRVPLRLAPWDSLFVVFRQADDPPHVTAADPGLQVDRMTRESLEVAAEANGSYRVQTASGQSVEIEFDRVPAAKTITGPWQVDFSAGLGAPDSVTFDALKSWTDHELAGIRHFSGIARYETDFDAPANWQDRGGRLLLDLGELWAVGEIRVNGRSLGILWKPPYRIDITDALHPDRNRLEIRIANTWANRLVGDARLPKEKRQTRTNVSRTLGQLWKDVPLRKCGLFGPVKLIVTQTKTVNLAQ